MCGIVGALSEQNVVGILIEGLKRLEYRGYDSAGLSFFDENSELHTYKNSGKVKNLIGTLASQPNIGFSGIAHTRWATHGEPSEINSHPHRSSDVTIVHNGIIENHEELRCEMQNHGYVFVSDTDTEVVAHLIHYYYSSLNSLKSAVKKTISRLEGAYALGVMCARDPGVLIGARKGSPLVLGLGDDENFIASDQMALRQVTNNFIFMEEGDLVELRTCSYNLIDSSGKNVKRKIVTIADNDEIAEKGNYKHFMLKEIFEQPEMLKATLQGRISDKHVLPEAFGIEATAIFAKVKAIHIIACGTSYHSGLIAKYWLEEWTGILCQVEAASEYRYRKSVILKDTLFVTISQSGETADTLAALQLAKGSGYLASLAICNVANSSLVRESDLVLMTYAGPEIGVASTKAFTTQLAALQLLFISLGKNHGLDSEKEQQLIKALHQLPQLCSKTLELSNIIEKTFQSFSDKNHALFLGRGVQFPVALEGALKLKEISYVHAEAYPAGELKHGPLALIDNKMPVIAVAPNNELLEKLKSNLHEVKARGGQLFVFADQDSGFKNEPGVTVIDLPHVPKSLEAIIYTLPLQLLSYHVAVLKGTDIDQPRNLAKSVTVE